VAPPRLNRVSFFPSNSQPYVALRDLDAVLVMALQQIEGLRRYRAVGLLQSDFKSEVRNRSWANFVTVITPLSSVFAFIVIFNLAYSSSFCCLVLGVVEYDDG
jgi:hypothetical protein